MINNVIIIGSGPAGHTAAIYCARANLSPVMLEGEISHNSIPGGQLTTTTDVENFPGFPNGILGYDLMENMRNQSLKAGTEILSHNANSVNLSVYPFEVNYTDSDGTIVQLQTKSIIIATGASAKKIEVEGVSTFWNKGISACAVCDGSLPMFRNKTLIVIGSGDSAMEEANYLSKFGKNIIILARSNKLRASKIMAQRTLNNDKISILYNTELYSCHTNTTNLTSIKIINNTTKVVIDLECNGLFFAIGHSPNTKFLNNQLTLDDNGYIITHDNVKTSIEGVFACGDVQDKQYRQAITAAGSGCMAALTAEKWLDS